MEKKIIVSNENQRKLENSFKCTHVMLWKALTFKSDSHLARKIRFVALRDYGGVPTWKPAAMETTHDTESGIMRQDFGNGVVLVADLSTGQVMLGVEKENPVTMERSTERVVAVKPAATIEELMMMQGEAVKMAMSL